MAGKASASDVCIQSLITGLNHPNRYTRETPSAARLLSAAVRLAMQS